MQISCQAYFVKNINLVVLKFKNGIFRVHIWPFGETEKGNTGTNLKAKVKKEWTFLCGFCYNLIKITTGGGRKCTK